MGARSIELPAIPDERGTLAFVEGARHVPFELKRIYYIYDLPGDAVRGGHAHRELEEVLIALSGSFDVLLDDGSSRSSVTLNRPHVGLYVPRLVWSELTNFSPGAVCLALASTLYDPDDYVYDYDEFTRAARAA